MRLPNHIFRNPHPGIAFVLFGSTAVLTVAYNYLIQGEVVIRNLDLWISGILVGFSAWFINIILVYRSKYLKPNYLLGWYWFCLLLVANPKGVAPADIFASLGIAVWLAIAFDLKQEGAKGLMSRGNLGLATAGLGFIWPAWWSLILASVAAIQFSQVREPWRHSFQVFMSWSIGLLIVLFLPAFTSELPSFWRQFIHAWPITLKAKWPEIGQYVIGFWLIIAGLETIRALSKASKVKRRGLLLTGVGILWAIMLEHGMGIRSMSGSLVAVFAAPHLVNVQAYLTHPWLIRLLDASLLATAFGLAWHV